MATVTMPERRLSDAAQETYKLYIPELGLRRPIETVLACPESILVAWHKDSAGIWQLLDGNGHGRYGLPQPSLWQVRVYDRAMHYPGAREAFYEERTR